MLGPTLALGARCLRPGAAALFGGGAAMASPPLALLLLAGLAAYVLLRGQTRRGDWLRLAGPVFAALIVGAFTGLPGAVGVLFVWRLFADAGWSVDEAARLARACGRPNQAAGRALAHAWASPIHGLALVAYTAPHTIAGLPLDLPHVPLWVPTLTGVLALLAVFDWGLKRAADWRLGELAAAPAAHLLVHHALFLLAFGLTLDVSSGIVAMAAWRLMHAARSAHQASFTAVP